MGSQTSSTAVTVCARSVVESKSTTSAKPATPVAKPAPKPVAKPIAKPPAPKPVTKAPPKVVLLTPIKTGVPASLTKPVAKPAPKTVVKAKPSVPVKSPAPQAATPAKTVSATSVNTAEADFSPMALIVSASENQVTVGEDVTFWTNAVTHYRSGALLGKATEVMFAPSSISWNFGNGAGGAGGTVGASFSSSGEYLVSANVRYNVSYRVAGSSDWVASGEITVGDSNSIRVFDNDDSGSGANNPEPISKEVKLVGKNCLARPDAFGCVG